MCNGEDPGRIWKIAVLSNKVSYRFLTIGVLCRAYMETYTIGRISFVKDPHYSLTVGRNSIGGMCCSLFGLGSRLCLENYMWQTLISKSDWFKVKMTVWEHNWGCVSGSIYCYVTTNGDQCLYKIFCPIIRNFILRKGRYVFFYIMDRILLFDRDAI